MHNMAYHEDHVMDEMCQTLHHHMVLAAKEYLDMPTAWNLDCYYEVLKAYEMTAALKIAEETKEKSEEKPTESKLPQR